MKVYIKSGMVIKLHEAIMPYVERSWGETPNKFMVYKEGHDDKSVYPKLQVIYPELSYKRFQDWRRECYGKIKGQEDKEAIQQETMLTLLHAICSRLDSIEALLKPLCK